MARSQIGEHVLDLVGLLLDWCFLLSHMDGRVEIDVLAGDFLLLGSADFLHEVREHFLPR